MGLFPAVWIAILIGAIVVQLWAHRSTTLWSLGVRSRLGRRLLLVAIALMVGEVAYRFGPVAIGPVALAVIGVAYWSPERRRTLVASAERAYAASADEVSTVLFDPLRQHRWMKGVRSVALIDQGPVKVGTRLRQTVELQGRPMSADLTVREFVPHERMVLELDVPDGLSRDVLELRAGPSGCHVRYSGSHTAPLERALLTGWSHAALKPRFTAWREESLRALEELLRRS